MSLWGLFSQGISEPVFPPKGLPRSSGAGHIMHRWLQCLYFCLWTDWCWQDLHHGGKLFPFLDALPGLLQTSRAGFREGSRGIPFRHAPFLGLNFCSLIILIAFLVHLNPFLKNASRIGDVVTIGGITPVLRKMELLLPTIWKIHFCWCKLKFASLFFYLQSQHPLDPYSVSKLLSHVSPFCACTFNFWDPKSRSLLCSLLDFSPVQPFSLM